MSARVDQSAKLARNPQVDPQRVEQAREMIRRMRALGIPPKGFRLIPPASVRRGAVRADDSTDDQSLFRPSSGFETDW